MSLWFYFSDTSRTAAENMAWDELLFSKAEEIPGFTCLRFYGWKLPTLSFGRSQRWQRVYDPAELERIGGEMVRRPTGGKAVLHWGELTYAVASSESRFLENPSVHATYTLLSSALLRGLLHLGLRAEMVGKDPRGIVKTDLPCFSYPTRDEIVLENLKIIGSAQKRSKFAFLQHGSIPVEDHRADYARLTRVEPSLLESTMTTLRLSGFKGDDEELRSAFLAGFQEEFSLKALPFQPTQDDEKRVLSLAREKYSSPDWNREL